MLYEINEQIDPYETCGCGWPNASPPCYYCISMTEYEADIWERYGEEGVKNVRLGLQEGFDFWNWPEGGEVAG